MNSEMPFTPAVHPAGGQHEVDDVLRHVVLAPGDEDLGPRDRMAAVTARFGLGAHRRGSEPPAVR